MLDHDGSEYREKNSNDVPTKSFTTFSITTTTRLHAICHTPTLTEPVGWEGK